VHQSSIKKLKTTLQQRESPLHLKAFSAQRKRAKRATRAMTAIGATVEAELKGQPLQLEGPLQIRM